MFEKSRDPRKWEPADERRETFCRGGQTACLLFAFHMALQIYKSQTPPLNTRESSPPRRMNGGRSGMSRGGRTHLSSFPRPILPRSWDLTGPSRWLMVHLAWKWGGEPLRWMGAFGVSTRGQVRAGLDSSAVTLLNWPFFIPRQQCPV